MSWDARSERITARAQAAKDRAEAEAIRVQAEAARAQAEEERRERREQQRAERRAARRRERAQRRDAFAAIIRRHAIPIGAIGSPELIAWRGQYQFAAHRMGLGRLSPLLPVALEGGVLYAAKLTLEAIDAKKPAGRYRAMTWTLAGVAAAMNFWHGYDDGGAQVGVALGLTSLLGIALLELTVALRQHKAGGRSAAEIRQALIRRIRYPRLSARAAAIAAARGITADEAWHAAWVDRYGLGPDSTRRARRTARKILARQQKTDRKAARAGELAIVDGRIVRTADVPRAEEPTRAEREAEALSVLFGMNLSDEALAAWLNEPPAGGSLAARTPPDGDGPKDGARGAGELAQISGDLGDRGREPADGDRLKASEARRTRGEQSRARIAAYMSQHPDHTIEQIATALGLSPATVKRHRRAIRSGE